MNPFDGLTPREHKLVKLALDFFRVLGHDLKEQKEYEDLLVKLEQAIYGDTKNG